MTKKFFLSWLLVLLLLTALAGTLFYLHPEWDSAATRLFYDAETSSFPAQYIQPYRFANEAVDYLAKGFAGAAGASLLYYLLLRRQTRLLPTREALFLLAVLAIGPGLIVNSLFKDNWGRARPSQTVEFGGVRQATPIWAISDQCLKNCSFPSGDASMGFYVMALAAIARHRRLWLAAGLLCGGMFGYVRVAQGAHYLSDVLHSGLFVAITALVCAYLFRLPLSAASR